MGRGQRTGARQLSAGIRDSRPDVGTATHDVGGAAKQCVGNLEKQEFATWSHATSMAAPTLVITIYTHGLPTRSLWRRGREAQWEMQGLPTWSHMRRGREAKHLWEEL